MLGMSNRRGLRRVSSPRCVFLYIFINIDVFIVIHIFIDIDIFIYIYFIDASIYIGIVNVINLI